jgi:hypothetical protein
MSLAQRRRPQSGRRWAISHIGTNLLPRVLLPTHHRAGARLPPEHHPRYAPASRASAASGRFGETVPKLIDERCNISRCVSDTVPQASTSSSYAAAAAALLSRYDGLPHPPDSPTPLRAASPATAAARRGCLRDFSTFRVFSFSDIFLLFQLFLGG